MLEEAARETRDVLFPQASGEAETPQLIARSISRAVWRQDVGFARWLIDTSVRAQDSLLVEGRSAALRHAPTFQLWTEGVHKAALEKEIPAAAAAPSPSASAPR
eukprot:1219343-Pyramimonas_sp.AAC.1